MCSQLIIQAEMHSQALFLPSLANSRLYTGIVQKSMLFLQNKPQAAGLGKAGALQAEDMTSADSPDAILHNFPKDA